VTESERSEGAAEGSADATAAVDRQQLSLTEPPDPDQLVGWPCYEDLKDLFRICRAGFAAPWKFSDDGRGRFDLVAVDGWGTCYTGSDLVACAKELLGPEYRPGKVLHAEWFEAREGWTLSPQTWGDRAPADLIHESWSSLITLELFAMVPYRSTQAWARALHEAGYGGIVAWLRHAPSHVGVSIFGPAGPQPKDSRFTFQDPKPLDSSFRQEFSRRFRIEVLERPSLDDLVVY
jgi:hypothetical protein